MFDSMVYHLTNNNIDTVVSRKEYEIFCKEFIFERLKGVKFGRAFCDRFQISNYLIPHLSDESAKDYIESQGFVV